MKILLKFAIIVCILALIPVALIILSVTLLLGLILIAIVPVAIVILPFALLFDKFFSQKSA